jgi:hypothetical protein
MMADGLAGSRACDGADAVFDVRPGVARWMVLLARSSESKDAELVGAGNPVTAVDVVFPPRARAGQVRGLAAPWSWDAAPCVLVSLRFACLAVLRVFGWLALLTRSGRVKDAEIRAPRAQLEVAM